MIFEKIVFNQLFAYLEANNLLSKHPSGFRPCDSTTNQFNELVNEIYNAFDDRSSLEARSVFLGLSKAFNKVWHDGLIFNLQENGTECFALKCCDS